MITVTSLGHATAIVRADETRMIVDPWLTRRLDRFWERNLMFPDAAWDEIDKGIDYVVLTHHHCDHLHYPSLDLLRERLGRDWARDTPIVFPEQGVPRPSVSGMGHLPIPLTLRKLGYATFRPVVPGESFELGDASVRSFKSRVPFPEMSMLVRSSKNAVMMCADAVLHPETWAWITAQSGLSITLALIPAHSYVPSDVLGERVLHVPYTEAVRRSILTFDRYWSTFGAQLTVPFASGWHVSATDGDFDWCNSVLWPWTPIQARDRLRDAGLQSELSTAGTVFTLKDGEPTDVSRLAGSPGDAEIRAADAGVRLRPRTSIPPFAPDRDTVGTQYDRTEKLIGRLADEFVGSESWGNALLSSRRYLVKLHDDTGAVRGFLIDPTANHVTEVSQLAPEAAGPNTRYVEITASTLQALFDGKIVYGSSWGLWTSNCDLLASVFHNPKWYQSHLDSAVSRYGAGKLASSIENQA